MDGISQSYLVHAQARLKGAGDRLTPKISA